ncbi:hypothetical protein K458DRAFT_429268 [Lentithecium fluviatile CBS 122367]|uniref:Uncharacterized protein n=1 Tax=Lentithecium fluviatile CBS 122367 TaxID=1168545 RepID=A0A6G1J9U0_9PLEO|nr:hypothetical protein K458DRAFT_429268 [Lentithecium fluviatile CBS 122367]
MGVVQNGECTCSSGSVILTYLFHCYILLRLSSLSYEESLQDLTSLSQDSNNPNKPSRCSPSKQMPASIPPQSTQHAQQPPRPMAQSPSQKLTSPSAQAASRHGSARFYLFGGRPCSLLLRQRIKSCSGRTTSLWAFLPSGGLQRRQRGMWLFCREWVRKAQIRLTWD